MCLHMYYNCMNYMYITHKIPHMYYHVYHTCNTHVTHLVVFRACFLLFMCMKLGILWTFKCIQETMEQYKPKCISFGHVLDDLQYTKKENCKKYTCWSSCIFDHIWLTLMKQFVFSHDLKYNRSNNLYIAFVDKSKCISLF